MAGRKVKRMIGRLFKAVKNILVLRSVGSNFNVGIDEKLVQNFYSNLLTP